MVDIKTLNRSARYYGKRLHQFGFSPSKLIASVQSQGGPKVLANSIPKAGTNLLIQTLCQIDQLSRRLARTLVTSGSEELILAKLAGVRENKIQPAHLGFSERVSQTIAQHDIKHILIVRDLRDVVTSSARYIGAPGSGHRLQKYFARQLHSDRERIFAVIEGLSAERLNGEAPSRPLAEHIGHFMPWISYPNCLVIRFEDLVGEKGGGDQQRQRDLTETILRYLQLSMPSSKIDELTSRIFSTYSRTYRSGQIGSWVNVFDHEIEKAFDDSLGEFQKALGYDRSEA